MSTLSFSILSYSTRTFNLTSKSPQLHQISSPLFPIKLNRSSYRCLRPALFSLNTSSPSEIPVEEIIEKDYSFIECYSDSDKEWNDKLDRIIAAGEIREQSRILVSLGAEVFVEKLVSSLSQCELFLVVHYSLYILAGIKAMYDEVKCWQGDLIEVPKKWAPFDCIFLCYLPALPQSLDQLFEALARNCSPGARLIIGCSQGRKAAEEHRLQHADVVYSNLPDQVSLEKTALTHSFQVTEFLDEPSFYLAVLRFCKE